MVYVLHIVLYCAAIVLQLTIIPLFAIKEIIPDLILIVVIATTLKHGRVLGIVSGFAAGLVFDAFGTGLLGLSSLAYSAAAYIVGVLASEQLLQGFEIDDLLMPPTFRQRFFQALYLAKLL